MNLQKRNTRIYLSSLWIWNFWAPFIPSRAPKPCTQKYLSLESRRINDFLPAEALFIVIVIVIVVVIIIYYYCYLQRHFAGSCHKLKEFGPVGLIKAS